MRDSEWMIEIRSLPLFVNDIKYWQNFISLLLFISDFIFCILT
jgi:hypothetical protein